MEEGFERTRLVLAVAKRILAQNSPFFRQSVPTGSILLVAEPF